MRDPDKKPPLIVALRLRYRDAYDAVSMLVYLFAIYIWGILVHPMGRDYEALASKGENLPFLVAPLFRGEIALFGAWLPGYHLVNLLLLYGCMLCIYHLTNLTVRGLWWFGTLAACMFMANPVHTEAIMNVSGIADLFPCLLALLALTGYAWQVNSPRPWKLVIALLLFVLASFPYAVNGYLVLVIFLYEILATPTGKHSFSRLGAFLVLGAAGLILNAGTLFAVRFDAAAMFTPLYFIFYPLGFLPETVMAFQTRPWLGWVAATVTVFLLVLIYRKARRPVTLFSLLAMLAIRLYPGDRPIDTITLIGGGQLLLPNALFVVGLVALFFRIMDHPKWRISMVGITSTIVIILFAMQFTSVRRWHEAGARVKDFQRQAQAQGDAAGAPIAILPDYRAYHGAPMWLSESIAHNTLFSSAIPAVGVLPVNAQRRDHLVVTVEEWSADGGRVALTGNPTLALNSVFPVAGLLTKEGDEAHVGELYGLDSPYAADARVRVGSVSATSVSLAVIAVESLPSSLVLPGPGEILSNRSSGKEPDQ